MTPLIFVLQFLLWGLAFIFICKIISRISLLEYKQPSTSSDLAYCIYETEFKEKQRNEEVYSYAANYWFSKIKQYVLPELAKDGLKISMQDKHCNNLYFVLHHVEKGELGIFKWDPWSTVERWEKENPEAYHYHHLSFHQAMNSSLIKAAKKTYEHFLKTQNRLKGLV